MTITKTIALLFMVVACFASLPSTFDVRYQPNIATYSNFNPAPATTCSAYDWALTLAQTLANAASIALE